MPSKYIWLLFLISSPYVLYTSNYYDYLQKFVKNYYYYIKSFCHKNPEELVKIQEGEILFTADALKKYTNLNNGLYLSILGQVFDVSSGTKHYGPGETYHVFTGRDGSAAFITGDFTEKGLTDDISSLTNKQIQSLMKWVEFYRKTYIYKGKLIGKFYNKDGAPTDERYNLEEKVQMAKNSDLNEEQQKIKFPPCNVEWNINSGTRVWCTKNSGGTARNWIGVPRMLYNSLDSKQYRCACVRLESEEYKENKEMIKEYEGCAKNSATCTIAMDKE